MEIKRNQSFYERYCKRGLDVICSLLAFFCFGWLYIIIAFLVRKNLGSPVFFKQPRPGIIDPKTGQERIFNMYKFRTMTDERDNKGNLLPDDERLGTFGRMLRSTSLDELPEAFNILKGDMSVIGPRPQLVRDMVFMTDKQRLRHTAKPGLSGLAQVMGRNAISWDDKFRWDLEYIQDISFKNDALILLKTVLKVFIKKANENETDITLDLGDALLSEGIISEQEYEKAMLVARELLEEHTK